ncbi:MAG: hypothetical protein Aurels2KO_49540 [Aureliella sp.]
MHSVAIAAGKQSGASHLSGDVKIARILGERNTTCTSRDDSGTAILLAIRLRLPHLIVREMSDGESR